MCTEADPELFSITHSAVDDYLQIRLRSIRERAVESGRVAMDQDPVQKRTFDWYQGMVISHGNGCWSGCEQKLTVSVANNQVTHNSSQQAADSTDMLWYRLQAKNMYSDVQPHSRPKVATHLLQRKRKSSSELFQW
jgi:hypothetical protein